MRLGKTTLLIILIGVFIIILAGLGAVRAQQVRQQSELNEKLTLAQSNLRGVPLQQLSSQQAELEEQLSQATPEFEAARATLFQPVGSINATSVLFDIAEAYDLEVAETTSSELATESLGEITFSVIILTAKVEGDVPNLVSFVTRLNSHFKACVVKEITMTIPETTSEEEASVDIQLAVYTYQGS